MLYLSLVWQPWTSLGLRFLGCKSGIILTLLRCYKKYIRKAFSQCLAYRKPVEILVLFYYVLNNYMLNESMDYNHLSSPQLH